MAVLRSRQVCLGSNPRPNVRAERTRRGRVCKPGWRQYHTWLRPGFTSISMYPKMWEQSGLPFPALLDRLIALALDRHARKQATRFTR